MDTAPYGSWKSPITSDLIVAETVGLGAPQLAGGEVYWLEMRPKEAGRHVVVRRTGDGRTEDVTPAPFNARTRVHEYGGGSYLATEDGTVYFTNFPDQRLYRVPRGGAPEAITPENGYRFADFVLDKARNRLIAVCEDHTTGRQYPTNSIAEVPLGGGRLRMLASGRDFYSNPRLTRDGAALAWLEWDHPNMPWDGTELWTAPVRSDGWLDCGTQIAGGEDESVFQPEWSPDATLHFVSDRTGWWNLYRFADGEVEALAEMPAEFGLPQWVFGMSTYDFESAQSVLCVYRSRGTSRMARLDAGAKRLTDIDMPYTEMSSVRIAGGKAIFTAASSSTPSSIVSLDLATLAATALKRSTALEIDSGYLSAPEPIEFPTEGGATAHALYYPPKNKDYRGPAGERPPLVVRSHGGPTSAASAGLSLSMQYWTSRGIAVVDVNYRGSTGYGREYRNLLRGRWGIADVDDCVNAAKFLVERDDVDGRRLAIAGGSAGGYTTLCALAFRDFFAAGASHYGVSDAEALARDTHKFESRYLDRLIAPYPARRDVYVERSPVHFPDRLSAPVIFFQGLEDKIVPPDQAERMVEALKSKGVPVAYVAFPGEQHGFRKAENIKRALDGELYFYSRVFGFKPADALEPVEIMNAERLPR